MAFSLDISLKHGGVRIGGLAWHKLVWSTCTVRQTVSSKGDFRENPY